MVQREDRMLASVRLDQLPVRFWVLAVPATVLAGLVIGIPTAVVPSPLFTRMTPVRPLDAVFWVVTSVLLGLLGATYLVPRRDDTGGVEHEAVGGGVLSVLAVGCPLCNKLVVLALGVSGALTYFAPIQPLLGLASVALLAYSLRLRFRQLRDTCTVR
jgi:hypothetical protein